ncbi:MAG: cupin domain-containing protein [Rhodospirillales bacterium]
MAKQLKLPAFDPATLPEQRGTSYPSPYREKVAGRVKRKLGDAAGLTQFGVNLVTLPPGAYSSMRHWHKNEDEFVYVLSGELTLVTDAGEQILAAGDACGFPAGKADGHHMINRSKAPAAYLEVGTRVKTDRVDYPDIDMRGVNDGAGWKFVRKDGRPY